MSDDQFRQKVVEALDYSHRVMTAIAYGETAVALNQLQMVRMLVGSLRESVRAVDEDEKTRA